MADATLDTEVGEVENGCEFYSLGSKIPLAELIDAQTGLIKGQKKPAMMSANVEKILLDCRTKHGKNINDFCHEVIFKFQEIRALRPDLAKRFNLTPNEVNRWISYINFQYQILNC